MNFLAGWQHGQEQAALKAQGAAVVAAEEVKFPHEVYHYIMFKCFDACIGNFDNKHLDSNEGSCVEDCIY